ncbi:cobalt ECF transporter T component CbiQ [Leptolyngbya iicbica]|uniref:Cobalt ECF transporter T component CbiQ n=2 Tax=Cyanophyceae TaxID=3028117 RepID=A0A4Q7EFR5_9CYAN|nr:cobalt ECF transporter T component CbiQ [Leptolyngbya sp. LK]RZM81876.1 cobalt ECF transporter T component CbiQ [Leptolyngbya sp. LK]
MAVSLHADVYIPGQSAIHRWAARPKLLSLLGLMFAIAMVRHLVLLPWVFGVVISLYLWSQLPFTYLCRRLPYPGLFIVAMVGLLPWISGETVLWQGWIFSLRLEGIQMAALIAGRFLAILTTGFVLLGTTPFLTLLEAMRSLGIPTLLTDMTLLTYRYLFDVANQLATMRQAMELRGYGHSRQTLRRHWNWLAALFGSLLLRSYEQSQRVYSAMRLRGYGQQPPRALQRTAGAALTLPTILTLTAAVSVVICELSLASL